MIKEIESYPLSDSDIRQILGNDIKIYNYPELKTVRPMNLFDKQGRCILLCPNASPNSGHWVGLINHKDYIEYFNSYGEKPEQEKKGLGSARLKALDIDSPDLTRLLRAIGKPVYYNKHQFQSNNPCIATCGKHITVRMLYPNATLDEYYKIVKKSKMKPDEFVSCIIYDKIKK